MTSSTSHATLQYGLNYLLRFQCWFISQVLRKSYQDYLFVVCLFVLIPKRSPVTTRCIFFKNSYDRHPIVYPSGRGMYGLLVMNSPHENYSSFQLPWCMQYHIVINQYSDVIWVHDSYWVFLIVACLAPSHYLNFCLFAVNFNITKKSKF